MSQTTTTYQIGEEVLLQSGYYAKIVSIGAGLFGAMYGVAMWNTKTQDYETKQIYDIIESDIKYKVPIILSLKEEARIKNILTYSQRATDFASVANKSHLTENHPDGKVEFEKYHKKGWNSIEIKNDVDCREFATRDLKLYLQLYDNIDVELAKCNDISKNTILKQELSKYDDKIKSIESILIYLNTDYKEDFKNKESISKGREQRPVQVASNDKKDVGCLNKIKPINTTFKTMKIIRWILSPLGAVAALVVVRFILKLMTITSGGYGIIVYVWNNIVSEGVAAAACVLVGAAIAPTYNKNIVSIIYATIFCCLCIVSFFLAIEQSYTFSQYLPIIVSFVGAIAGAIASRSVLEDFE